MTKSSQDDKRGAHEEEDKDDAKAAKKARHEVDAVGNPIKRDEQGRTLDADGKPLPGPENPHAKDFPHVAAAHAQGPQVLAGGVQPNDPRAGRKGVPMPPGAQPAAIVPLPGVSLPQPQAPQPVEGGHNPARIPENPSPVIQGQDRQAFGGAHPAGKNA